LVARVVRCTSGLVKAEQVCPYRLIKIKGAFEDTRRVCLGREFFWISSDIFRSLRFT